MWQTLLLAIYLQSPINISILEMRKARSREKEIAPIDTAIKWQRMIRTLGRAVELVLLHTMLYDLL